MTPRGTSSAAFVRSTKKINLERRSLRGREISVSSDEEEDDEDEEGGNGKTRKAAKTPPPKRKLKSREELKQQKQNKVGVEATIALFSLPSLD